MREKESLSEKDHRREVGDLRRFQINLVSEKKEEEEKEMSKYEDRMNVAATDTTRKMRPTNRLILPSPSLGTYSAAARN